MSKRRHREDDLGAALAVYAEEYELELKTFNHETQHRLVDILGNTIDVWPSTGRYYIIKTNYHKLKARIRERQGELGYLPAADEIDNFLGRVFFPLDYA